MDLFAFDDDYVRRLREGDRWTVEHYLEYFRLFLTAKLRKRGVPSGDVGDLIQETHARVFNELRGDQGIRDGHRFGAYVSSVCNHVLQEYWRLRVRETEELKDVFPSPDNPFEDSSNKETVARVERTLRRLAKENQRDADLLRDFFLRELDKDAICLKYDVDRNYLRVLVHRALKKFRELYDKDPGH
jgi:RNA polymerase sigma factor (sigma-70 family)